MSPEPSLHLRAGLWLVGSAAEAPAGTTEAAAPAALARLAAGASVLALVVMVLG